MEIELDQKTHSLWRHLTWFCTLEDNLQFVRGWRPEQLTTWSEFFYVISREPIHKHCLLVLCVGLFRLLMLNNQWMSIKHGLQLNLLGRNLDRNARAATSEIFRLCKVKWAQTGKRWPRRASSFPDDLEHIFDWITGRRKPIQSTGLRRTENSNYISTLFRSLTSLVPRETFLHTRQSKNQSLISIKLKQTFLPAAPLAPTSPGAPLAP